MKTDSLYSIDSMIYSIYSDLQKENDLDKKYNKIIDDIISMYTPIEKKSTWFEKTFNPIFKIKAYCDFVGKKDCISFKCGQEFYVLKTFKKEKLYLVSDNDKTPFSVNARSGKVPSYYFNKI